MKLTNDEIDTLVEVGIYLGGALVVIAIITVAVIAIAHGILAPAQALAGSV